MKTKTLLAAAILTATSATTAHAGSKPTLPTKYHGHWCYDGVTNDYRLGAPVCNSWINIHPTGFSMSDGYDGPYQMHCTLKSTSLKLDVFQCRTKFDGGEIEITTEHMRLHIDHNYTLHLGWKTGANQ